MKTESVMKKIQCLLRFLLPLILAFGITKLSYAQWVQTNWLYGGDVTCFTVSDTNLFAGTYDLGVFHSTNNGTGWTEVVSGLTDYHVLSLAVSDTDLFAGTQYGGIFRSTDNGTSWTAVNTGLTNPFVTSLVVSDANLFAGTYGGGVVLSTDTGTSWTAVNSGLTIPWVWSLAASGSNLYAGTWGGVGGIFRSTDNGTSWTAVNTGLTNPYVIRLAVSDTNLFAAIEDSGVFRTTNHGTSWTSVNTGLADNIVRSFAVSGTNLFAGTQNGGIFLSTDAGTSWTAVNTGLTGLPHTTVYSLAVSGTNLIAGTLYGIWRRPLWEMIPAFSVTNKWNIVCISKRTSDYSKSVLFPSAVSDAFTFQNSYVRKDTLSNGIGYWLEFDHAQDVYVQGDVITSDTIDVVSGWNLVGSISSPVVASGITSNPGGMITSNFYGYKSGYFVTDTIQPGKGYWVKVNQNGGLILSALSAMSVRNRIKIVETTELPPSPPDEQSTNLRAQIPKEFALNQNFPNPFNPSTQFTYALPTSIHVTLKIFNVLGQEVVTVVDRFEGPGYKSLQFDASKLSTGIYFYRLQAGKFTDIKKMVLLK